MTNGPDRLRRDARHSRTRHRVISQGRSPHLEGFGPLFWSPTGLDSRSDDPSMVRLLTSQTSCTHMAAVRSSTGPTPHPDLHTGHGKAAHEGRLHRESDQEGATLGGRQRLTPSRGPTAPTDPKRPMRTLRPFEASGLVRSELSGTPETVARHDHQTTGHHLLDPIREVGLLVRSHSSSPTG